MSESTSGSEGTVAAAAGVRSASRAFVVRFRDAAALREYRRWRSTAVMPFALTGFLGCVPSWLALVVAIGILSPAALPIAAPAILGWVMVLLVLVGLTLWAPARNWIDLATALSNSFAGFLVAWLLHDVATLELTPAIRDGLMGGGVLIVMFFGFAIFRIPPGQAIAGVTPYVGFALSYFYTDYRTGQLDAAVAGAYASMVLIGYGGGVFGCVVNEIVTRRTYVKDRIIELQKRQLADSRDAIRRYMPPAVAQRIIRGESASVRAPLRRRVTILFCDIVGFTDIVDRVEPETISQVLGDYLGAMSELIDAAGGTLNEFAGDGLMALFGAPDEVVPTEQARRSVQAARAMQEKMVALNESWRVLGLGKELTVRIGINTGMASVGSYGSPGRMTYTAVGLATNIAARLETAAEPGQILISETVFQLIRDEIACTPRGALDCKGVHFTVPVYALLTAPPMAERMAAALPAADNPAAV